MSGSGRSEDELVPLDPSRLEMLLERRQLTVLELARRTGLKQQTIDAMLHADRTKARRCRRAFRDQLAITLGVPSRWLGREMIYLSPRVGYIGDATDGEAFEFGRVEEPGASDFARYELQERCRQARARDILAREGVKDADSIRVHPTAFAPLQHAVNQLADAVWWSGQLLNPEVPEEFIRHPQPKVSATRPVTPDSSTRDRVETLLLEALAALLEPWFQGRAELRYENLLALGGRWWWQAVPGANEDPSKTVLRMPPKPE
jgi:hypothetical protein